MSHVGLWSSKNGKKSSRNTSLTSCWLMTLREETDDARLILLLTKYACRVKKKWLLLNITHQKSPEEERLYRSSELAKQFPRMRRRNVSSLYLKTFDKLFVWLKNTGKNPPRSESAECRDFDLSLIHIWRCRRSTLCRSRWSPYH